MGDIFLADTTNRYTPEQAYEFAEERIDRWIEASAKYMARGDPLPSLNLNNICLTKLPPLPDNLTVLKCRINKLTHLPTLPESLVRIECEFNKFTFTRDTLPESLPDSLTVFRYNSRNVNHLPGHELDEITNRGISLFNTRYNRINSIRNYLLPHGFEARKYALAYWVVVYASTHH